MNWKSFTTYSRDLKEALKGGGDRQRSYQNPDWRGLDLIRVLGEGILIFSVFTYCFYHSLYPFILLPLFLWYYWHFRRKQAVKARKELLRRQFRDGMLSISAALQVGYSLENAVSEAADEMKGLWGKDSDIGRELEQIARSIGMNQSVEIQFYLFAERSQISEVLMFAEVLRCAKRTGGNLIQITKNTAAQLGEKIRIQQEIQASLAASRMQERIMCVAPVGILIYLKLSAPDLLAGMYGTPSGCMVMSGCLFVYLLAFWMIQRIGRLPV